MSWEAWGDGDDGIDHENCFTQEDLDGATDNLKKHVDELTMLVRRLSHSLKSASANSELPAQAMDYLHRNGLQGSVLRGAGNGSADQT